QQLTGTLMLAVFTAVLGSFQYGYNTGVINAPQKIIEAHYSRVLGLYQNETASYDDIPNKHALVTMHWSLSVSIFSVGGIISSFFVGWIADKLGRTKAMMVGNSLAIVGSLFMGLAKFGPSHILIIIGRVITGLYCGLASGLVPMYVGEISPTAMRGALGTLHQVAVVVGILISQLIGLDFLLGNDVMWPLLLGLSGVPAVLQAFLLIFCPESPRYLFIKLGKEEEAKKCKKQSSTSFDSEYYFNYNLNKEPFLFFSVLLVLECFATSFFQPSLEIRAIFTITPWICSFKGIFYYSTSIFIRAGVHRPLYATIGVGVVNTVFTIVSVLLVERAGRRSLFMLGLGGMCASAVMMTVGLTLLSKFSWMSYVSMAATFMFVTFFEIGPGPIPWFIVTELFSQGLRPAAITVAGFCNWTCNFIIGMCFQYIADYCGPYVFIIFAVLLFGFTVFTYFKVPETKGKTFEEIAANFRHRRHPPEGPNEVTEMEHLAGSTDA
uniref:Solute carrier family 2 member 2 n=1 Tax=Latimeria chalumnae TaxID=7897 RepID=H3AYT7_LATCH